MNQYLNNLYKRLRTMRKCNPNSYKFDSLSHVIECVKRKILSVVCFILITLKILLILVSITYHICSNITNFLLIWCLWILNYYFFLLLLLLVVTVSLLLYRVNLNIFRSHVIRFYRHAAVLGKLHTKTILQYLYKLTNRGWPNAE